MLSLRFPPSTNREKQSRHPPFAAAKVNAALCLARPRKSESSGKRSAIVWLCSRDGGLASPRSSAEPVPGCIPRLLFLLQGIMVFYFSISWFRLLLLSIALDPSTCCL